MTALHDLSLDARSLPESLRLLSKFGGGPLGAVVLDRAMLAQFAAAAQELLEAVDENE